MGNTKLNDESSGARDVSDFNKELKSIRTTRLETGCNCKPIKIDKLSVVKMKSELISLGGIPAEVEKLNKSDLTTALKEKLLNCRLCIDNGCSCVEMCIPCSAESCGCLKGGNKSHNNCANPNGQEIFNPEDVFQYRCAYVPSLRSKEPRRASF